MEGAAASIAAVRWQSGALSLCISGGSVRSCRAAMTVAAWSPSVPETMMSMPALMFVGAMSTPAISSPTPAVLM